MKGQILFQPNPSSVKNPAKLLLVFSILIKRRKNPCPEFFSCSTQLSTKFQLLIKLKYRQMNKFLALSLSDAFFIMMLINVKLAIVGILTFINWINFVLN